MKTLKNFVCLLALLALAGCALTGGSGSSQQGVTWSGSQNLQIGNNAGKK